MELSKNLKNLQVSFAIFGALFGVVNVSSAFSFVFSGSRFIREAVNMKKIIELILNS